MTVAHTCLFVVGMHRSGTSCLAGTLSDAGVPFGDVNRKARHNPKGNIENRRVMDINNAVLANGGGSWLEPVTGVWTDTERAERDEVLSDYSNWPLFGIKDPRLLFTLDGWLEAVADQRLIATFRHPLGVAASLQRRNRMPLDEGLDLWLRYNERLLELSTRLDVGVVHFPQDRPTYLANVAAATEGLGLSLSGAGESFFDKDLVHHEAAGSTGRSDVDAVYEALLELIDG